eukprot:TRINITY_DN17509_c0_g1_i8.p1 TRINITY_DN17509_c0_g1~~TRINITY_DN17509_c0_g1_i8.p1  ORF type:complete len:711 (+),score=162.70 TRINITY_DN17509_c0_g1_i8:114-2246(+)
MEESTNKTMKNIEEKVPSQSPFGTEDSNSKCDAIALQHYKNMMTVEKWTTEFYTRQNRDPNRKIEESLAANYGLPSFIYLKEDYPVMFLSQSMYKKLDNPPSFLVHKNDLQPHRVLWNLNHRDHYEERADKCIISKVFQDIQNLKKKKQEQIMKNCRKQSSSPDSPQGEEDSKASSCSGSHDEGEAPTSLPSVPVTATKADKEMANISKSANADAINDDGSCDVSDCYFWTNCLDPDSSVADGEDVATVIVAAAEETSATTECTAATKTTTTAVSTTTLQDWQWHEATSEAGRPPYSWMICDRLQQSDGPFRLEKIGEAEDSNLEVELQVICPREDPATSITTPLSLPEKEPELPESSSSDDDASLSPDETATEAPDTVAMNGALPDGDTDCEMATAQTSALPEEASARLDDIDDYREEDNDMDAEYDSGSNGHLDGKEQMLYDSKAMYGGQDPSEQGQEMGEEQQLFPLDLHTTRHEPSNHSERPLPTGAGSSSETDGERVANFIRTSDNQIPSTQTVKLKQRPVTLESRQNVSLSGLIDNKTTQTDWSLMPALQSFMFFPAGEEYHHPSVGGAGANGAHVPYGNRMMYGNNSDTETDTDDGRDIHDYDEDSHHERGNVNGERIFNMEDMVRANDQLDDFLASIAEEENLNSCFDIDAFMNGHHGEGEGGGGRRDIDHDGVAEQGGEDVGERREEVPATHDGLSTPENL